MIHNLKQYSCRRQIFRKTAFRRYPLRQVTWGTPPAYTSTLSVPTYPDDEFDDCMHGFALALVAANKRYPLEAASKRRHQLTLVELLSSVWSAVNDLLWRRHDCCAGFSYLVRLCFSRSCMYPLCGLPYISAVLVRLSCRARLTVSWTSSRLTSSRAKSRAKRRQFLIRPRYPRWRLRFRPISDVVP